MSGCQKGLHGASSFISHVDSFCCLPISIYIFGNLASLHLLIPQCVEEVLWTSNKKSNTEGLIMVLHIKTCQSLSKNLQLCPSPLPILKVFQDTYGRGWNFGPPRNFGLATRLTFNDYFANVGRSVQLKLGMREIDYQTDVRKLGFSFQLQLLLWKL